MGQKGGMLDGGKDTEVQERGENEKEHNSFYGRRCCMDQNWADGTCARITLRGLSRVWESQKEGMIGIRKGWGR